MVFTADDSGSRWALAIATGDLDKALEGLLAQGVQIRARKKLTRGFGYALYHDPHGVARLVYLDET